MVTQNDRASKSWTLEQLETYAAERVASLRGLAKKTVQEVYFFGECLSFVRENKKGGKDWIRWLDAQPYSRTSGLQAVKFFENVGPDIDLLSDMTLTEAKIVVGVIKPPVKKEKPAQKQTVDKRTHDEAETSKSVEDSQSDNAVQAGAHLETKSEVAATGELLGKVLNLLTEVEKRGVTVEHVQAINDIQDAISRIIHDAMKRVSA